MKDFNEVLSKDREFKVQDQLFHWHNVKPEILSSFDTQVNGAEADDPNATWKLMDRQILLFIEEEQHERWMQLRAREKDPVTIAQINAILNWLLEQQTGLPTEQPSPSAPGRGRTASSSRAG